MKLSIISRTFRAIYITYNCKTAMIISDIPGGERRICEI